MMYDEEVLHLVWLNRNGGYRIIVTGRRGDSSADVSLFEPYWTANPITTWCATRRQFEFLIASGAADQRR